ncbi:MAG: Sua5/YciO/YrdC/YwlC family protein, partial [Candidatus Obscuribacterales bacterium]|nr:Sua5/YciO/YrdC/YwlC family protein [Steroidobacteraceae bacterium]
PGEDLPLTDAWEIQERLLHVVDAVVDGGNCGLVPTSVIDLAGEVPVVLRQGRGVIHALV